MKSKASKKPAKKAPAKKKSAAKKKPVKSPHNYDRKPIETWAADIAEKAYDDARELMEKGADPRKIKVHVFDRSVHDAMVERNIVKE